MATLPRSGGGSTSYTAAQLEALAVHLIAASQAFVESGGVVFWRAGVQSLLLVDVESARNRRLTETFELAPDEARPFAVKFRLGASDYSLLAAFATLGYVLPADSTLASLHMASYALGGGVVLAAGQLVADGGSWNTRAAQLKSLAAGSGLSLAEANGVRAGGRCGLAGRCPSHEGARFGRPACR